MPLEPGVAEEATALREASLLEHFLRLPPLGLCHVEPALRNYFVPFFEALGLQGAAQAGARQPSADAGREHRASLYLQAREVIWVDIALKHCPLRNNLQGNLASVSLMLHSPVELARFDLHTLIMLHARARGQVVDTAGEAETVFSVHQGVTPFHMDNVRADLMGPAQRKKQKEELQEKDGEFRTRSDSVGCSQGRALGRSCAPASTGQNGCN